MRTLRLFMTMSCDGYFAGPDGELRARSPGWA
jgi:hypothetical protein